MDRIKDVFKELGRINLFQSPHVIQAVNQTHRQSQTRTTRSFQAVGSNISEQIELQTQK